MLVTTSQYRGEAASGTPAANVGLEVYPAHADVIAAGKLSVASARVSGYTVSVSNGGTPEDSPVYYTDQPYWDLIDGSNLGMTREMHWTQFSIDVLNAPFTVVVTLPTESVAGATIRCGSWAGGTRTPTINTGAHTITFTISQIGTYYVHIPSMEVVQGSVNTGFPLFLFVSAIEVPPVVNGTTIKNFTSASMSMTGVDELVFQPGLWDLDPNYVTNGNVITEWLTAYGKSIYIKGGAWVKGMLDFDGGSGVARLRGRGVLSGEKYTLQAEDNSNIIIHGISQASSSLEVSGIVVTDSPSKNFICDNLFHLYDTKFFGITGDAATMRTSCTKDLCFTMVNDDHAKLYYSNATITRETSWLRKVGPVAQISWQVGTNPTGCVVDGVHIVGADRPNLSATGTYTQQINAAVIVCANVAGGDMSGYTFRNITSDVEVYQLFAYHLAWPAILGFDDGLGSLAGFIHEDISVPAVTTFSYFNGNGTTPGTITGFHFDNVLVGGVKITSANRASYFKWAGNDGQATFTYA